MFNFRPYLKILKIKVLIFKVLKNIKYVLIFFKVIKINNFSCDIIDELWTCGQFDFKN